MLRESNYTVLGLFRAIKVRRTVPLPLNPTPLVLVS